MVCIILTPYTPGGRSTHATPRLPALFTLFIDLARPTERAPRPTNDRPWRRTAQGSNRRARTPSATAGRTRATRRSARGASAARAAGAPPRRARRARARRTARRRSRGRARNGTTTHYDRLWGRYRRLSIAKSRGASNAPRRVELQPSGPPPAAFARQPAAAPVMRAAEAREAARGSAPPPTTAASGGDLRLHPHLRLAAR